jgi:hypothetical protein
MNLQIKKYVDCVIDCLYHRRENTHRIIKGENMLKGIIVKPLKRFFDDRGSPSRS